MCHRLFCQIVVTFFVVSGVQASDLSDFLFGGRGSRTTVSDPYIPPPLMTEAPVVPVTDNDTYATTQSQLMLGSPGATTLPPGGVIAANGVAATGVSSASYVYPSPVTTASNNIPAVPVATHQPAIEYEWTYSTIKDVKYDPVTVYDPQLGGYVTSWQERQTESVLPWLHRKQVVRYKPPATDTMIGGTAIGTFAPPVASDTSERRIVNRLFPVSTVPSPPAQAVPVEMLPMSATPVRTYANATYATETPVIPTFAPQNGSQILPTTIHPSTSTVMRVGDLPVVQAVTIPQSGRVQPMSQAVTTAPAATLLTTQDQPAPISSSLADTPPALPPVVSPSAQQVLYPNDPANNIRSSGGNQSSEFSLQGSGLNARPEVRSSKPAPNQPTLAPPQTEQTPVSRDAVTLQRPLIEDSINASEKLRTVELPAESPLPPPAQSSKIPSLETASSAASNNSTASPNTTDSGIPLLTPGSQSSTQPMTQPATRQPSATGIPSGRNVSPTRMAQPL